jgi:hypothetical protein
MENINAQAKLTYSITSGDPARPLNKLKWPLLFSAAVAVALIAFLAASGPARALMLQLSLADLSSGADAIIVGTVLDLSSRWNSDHTRINTSVILSIEESLKSSLSANGQVTVSVPGGTVDGITEQDSDSPTFALGEKTVVFLKQNSESQFEVYGQFQGKFSVVNDKVNGQSLTELNKTSIRLANFSRP